MSAPTPKATTIANLFDQLEDWGAGSMALTTSDDEGNILSCIVVAKGENAQDIMTYYDREDARNSAVIGEVEP